MTEEYTKYWPFTWEPNVNQKKLPEIADLTNFLNPIADTAVFQEEKDSQSGKIDYEVCFTLSGPRQSKKSTLLTFENRFKNAYGLTLSKVFDKNASFDYIYRYTYTYNKI